MDKEGDIYPYSKPLMFVSKLLGLKPHHLTLTRSHAEKTEVKVTCSWASTSYSVAFIVILVINLIISPVVGVTGVYRFLSPTLYIPDILKFVLNFATGIAALTINMTCIYKQIGAVCMNVIKANKLILRGDAHTKYPPHLMLVLMMILPAASECCEIGVWIGVTNGLLNISVMITKILTNYIRFFVISQFVAWIMFVGRRFKHLNHALKNWDVVRQEAIGRRRSSINDRQGEDNVLFICRGIPFRNGLISRGPQDQNQTGAASDVEANLGKFYASGLASLRRAHHVLIELGLAVNTMFGVQILLDILYGFVSMTQTLYMGVEMGIREQGFRILGLNKTNLFWCSIVWTSVHMFKLILVIASCHWSRRESYKAVYLIQKLLLRTNLAREDRKELEQFSRQARVRKLVFNAAGFVVLDLPFLASVIGAIMTYLIVLLQFKT